MCIAPSTLPPSEATGEILRVGCRKCWQCRNDRVNDLVGRCIAESETCAKALAVTLTYREDSPASSTLVYRDVQNFVKSLRGKGGKRKVRYIVAGEYGAKKGRAHWHAVLFFQGEAPQVELERRVDWHHWPHGFSYFQEPDYDGFRYVLKYVLKDQVNEIRTGHLAMSKKPPLGAQWFYNLADRHVAAGLPIRSPSYSFREVRDRYGKPREFWLQGRMRELYLERYVNQWRELRGQEIPRSEILDAWQDAEARRWLDQNRQWKLTPGNAQDPDPEGAIDLEVQHAARERVRETGAYQLAAYASGETDLIYQNALGGIETWRVKRNQTLEDVVLDLRELPIARQPWPPIHV